MRPRSALIAATAIAVSAASASPASATLLSPQILSPAGEQVAGTTADVGANGDSAVSWLAGVDELSNVLRVRMRAAGGSWGQVTQLSTPGNLVEYSQIVVDSAGAATAVWTESVATESPGGGVSFSLLQTFTARRPAGGSWRDVVQLSNNGAKDPFFPAVAVGPDGQVVVVWQEDGRFKSATRTRTGTWSAPSTIPATNFGRPPAIAVGSDGNATAAWSETGDAHVMSAELVDGDWSFPTDVSGPQGGVSAMDMNLHGDATIVWRDADQTVLSSRRPTLGGDWSDPTQISAAGGPDLTAPSVIVDAAGRATAAWGERESGGDGVTYDVTASSRGSNGSWNAPVFLGAGDQDGIKLISNDSGQVSAVWLGFPGDGTSVVQTTSLSGGSWASPTDLTELGVGDAGTGTVQEGQPDAGMDADGDVLFVGTPSPLAPDNPASAIAQADDRAGPELDGLLIQQTARVGENVDLSVSPLDHWSDLGETTWDFGDGDTATGNSVSHTFTSTGSKTVTITSEDVLGHQTQSTSTIAVLEPFDATGPPGGQPAVRPPATPNPPATTKCVSRRVVTIHPDLPSANKLRSLSLSVTGRRTKRLKRSVRKIKIDLSGITASKVKVKITGKTTDGKRVSDTRVYKTCGG